MRVVVEGSVGKNKISDNVSPTKDALLQCLLDSSEYIELYKYSAGPPEGEKPLKTGRPLIDNSPGVYKGWAVLYPPKENGSSWPVTYWRTSGNGPTYSGVTGNLHEIATKINSQSYSRLPVKDREAKLTEDAMAMRVASEILGADIFITERAFLKEDNLFVKKYDTTICSEEEAIAVISLYLRAQGVFAIATGTTVLKLNYTRTLFYFAGANELLPATWRWRSAFRQASDDTLARLNEAVVHRLARALRYRDGVNIRLSSVPSDETIDDVLDNLEGLLITLLGASDATASVAHQIFGMKKGSSRKAAWHNHGWLKELDELRPQFTDFIGKNTSNQHALILLSALRNTIHQIALNGATFRTEDDGKKILIVLPQNDNRIMVSIKALGGEKQWGCVRYNSDIMLIDPGILPDKLTVVMIEFLNEIIERIPVEELPGVVIEEKDRKPVIISDGITEHLSDWKRLSIRWQLGF